MNTRLMLVETKRAVACGDGGGARVPLRTTTIAVGR
jgi:hypothetical protein